MLEIPKKEALTQEIPNPLQFLPQRKKKKRERDGKRSWERTGEGNAIVLSCFFSQRMNCLCIFIAIKNTPEKHVR